MCWSYSIRYSFKRCLALTVFLFKSRFFAKFLWFDDPSGRSAAGRMAPMAQFQLPAVQLAQLRAPSIRCRDCRQTCSPGGIATRVSSCGIDGTGGVTCWRINE